MGVCKHKTTNAERLVKIYSREHLSESLERRIANEVNLLKKIDHPNIIRLYEVFSDDKNYYLIEE